MRVAFGNYREMMKNTPLHVTRNKLRHVDMESVERSLELRIPYVYVVSDGPVQDSTEQPTETQEQKEDS
jgi:hypothetical protein